MAVGRFDAAQSLYAFADHVVPGLVGCVVYVRESYERITVVHIAVAEGHVMSSDRTEVPLAVRLLGQVVEIAKRINGLQVVAIEYAGDKSLQLRVDQ